MEVDMEEWRFVFEDETNQSQTISSGVEDTLGSGSNEKSKKTSNSKKGFADTVEDKASEKLFEQTVVSPLNTVTGQIAILMSLFADSIFST